MDDAHVTLNFSLLRFGHQRYAGIIVLPFRVFVNMIRSRIKPIPDQSRVHDGSSTGFNISELR